MRKELSAFLGMYEMECAVEVMLQKAERLGKTVDQLVFYPEEFIEGSGNLVGFCQLIHNGWVLPGYPNCEFYLANGLIDRLNARFNWTLPYCVTPAEKWERITAQWKKEGEKHGEPVPNG